jgi:proteasome accessory factor B
MSGKQKRTGRKRGPRERARRIGGALRAAVGPVGLGKLAKRFGVSEATVRRDIDFLRRVEGLGIRFDRRRGGYVLEKTRAGRKGRPEEFSAIFHAWLALGGTERGGPLDAVLGRAFDGKVRRLSGGELTGLRQLKKKVARLPSGEARIDPVIFGRVVEALIRRRELEFLYRKHFESRSQRRRVRPYLLAESEDCWYLVGFDTGRGETRTFAMPRVKGPRVLEEGFEVPADFDAGRYFGDSFGVWLGDGRAEEIVLELDGYAARLAQERKWHASQRVKVLDARAERVRVSFHTAVSNTLLRLILSFGPRARVVKPARLKEQVARRIREMARALDE